MEFGGAVVPNDWARTQGGLDVRFLCSVQDDVHLLVKPHKVTFRVSCWKTSRC